MAEAVADAIYEPRHGWVANQHLDAIVSSLKDKGVTFEHYDSLGRYRDIDEDGEFVDARGGEPGTMLRGKRARVSRIARCHCGQPAAARLRDGLRVEHIATVLEEMTRE